MKDILEKNIIPIVVAALSLLVWPELALSNGRFETLWLEQGLPGRTVWALEQDEQGFIWIATENGLARYDGHKMRVFQSDPDDSSTLSDFSLRSLKAGQDNQLWIGTHEGGLNRYDPLTETFTRFTYRADDQESIRSNKITALEYSRDGGLWVGTDNGLDRFDPVKQKFNRIELKASYLNKNAVQPAQPESHFKGLPIHALEQSRSGTLWISTNEGVIVYDHNKDQVTPFTLMEGHSVVRVIHEATDGKIWFGTAGQGLYFYDPQRSRLQTFDSIKTPMILSISSDKFGNVWVGTFEQGLYRIDSENIVTNYRYDKHNTHSFGDNFAISLLVDNSGTLWAGTFSAGVSRLDIGSLNFGLHNDNADSVSCLPSPSIYAVRQDKENNLWIASESGLVYYNRRNGECKVYQHNKTNHQSLADNIVLSLHFDNDEVLWVGSRTAYHRFNRQAETFERFKIKNNNEPTYSITEDADGKLWLAGESGLFIRDKKSGELTQVTGSDTVLNQTGALSVLFGQEGIVWVATKKGLAKFDRNSGEFNFVTKVNPVLSAEVGAMFLDHKNILWLGLNYKGLFAFDTRANTIKNFADVKLPVNNRFGAILPGKPGELWISSDKGLVKFNTHEQVSHRFDTRDGLQSNSFIRGSSFRAADGELFFGGRRGFNAFFPSKVSLNAVSPQTVITQFYRFNKPVKVKSDLADFSLAAPISLTDNLFLSHRDSDISFEFSALHYADPQRNTYAYKMEGYDQEWNYTSVRLATYTNLFAGDYVFKVKSANKDGIWSEQTKELTISIQSAPWFSWWAFSLYFLMLILSIYALIHVRTAAAKRRANLLSLEVKQRTSEIKEKNQVIEGLLARKNELFANVSHEFRTPLTLILGPVQALIKQLPDGEAKQQLSIVKRNANRLVGMVDQLLILAKLSKHSEEKFLPQPLEPILNFLVESFQSVADEKSIQLWLESGENNDKESVRDTIVKATPDSIETVIGNLISNALKYTPRGGQVKIRTSLNADTVSIDVIDSGPGISEDELQFIFDRFTRLKRNQNTPGTGLGLSVVKQVLEFQRAEIKVNSQVGRGTTFSVRWPLDLNSVSNSSVRPVSTTVNQLVSSINEEVNSQQLPVDLKETDAKDKSESVLIVDDNPDMRLFISQSLSRYHCLFASDGQEGVAKALTEVPDLIVCDLMMPGLDGFQVCRVIRSDERTSHIPIVLLTAKGDEESRLKGWQEQVDEFLTKPFNSRELELRVRNILILRDIRKNKLGHQVAQGNNKQDLQLSKIDQKFIDKLDQLLEKNFADPGFDRAQMAKSMAVSERQLQRKLKALINFNPSDYVREFRLRKATKLLVDGNQIAVVSDRCGFVSNAHFSRCFKAQYGMSPKQYKETGKV
ncbi:two-component regulator propeller domain-containing protein [Aliikangiella coralliicola]|uniref:histidine kinase n=1 Tax=Aliikangiella coralliicola TaxID=2592383 RepID=A0A545UIQ2_9GAMM|nr:two-component regulator propeller domain-containing protein [Aliikangiella coralliicola]TQV89337.1 response regulator [Aliikangiella coralliicola]